MRAPAPLLRLSLLLSVLLPCTPVLAGEPPTGDLRSKDLRLVAWGAWHAAEQGRTEARPLIQAALIRALAQDEPQLQHLLDAAIRLGVLPPPDVMAPLARIRPSAAAILCCRHGRDAPDTVLAAFDVLRPAGDAWIAVGNALAGWRSGGLALRALRDLEIRRTVRATDGNTLRPFRTPSGHVCWDGILRRRPGWPPTVHRELSLDPMEPMLSPGRYPVYVLRRVVENETWIGGVCEGGPSADACRFGWLGIDVPADGVVDICYLGKQPWERSLNALAHGLRDRVFARARILLFDKRLTKAEARTLAPRVRVTVIDRRRDWRHPLPDVRLEPPQNPWVRPGRR